MITLRDVRIDDKDMLRNWRNLPEIAKFMYTDHYITPEEHERWFTAVFADSLRRYWIIVMNDQDVGTVHLYNIDEQNRRCYWAFYLASPDVRGKGIGSFVEYSILQYVFEQLQFNKLCCEVLDFNESVVKLHKSFGFSQEGLFRQHIFKEGRFMDVVCLAILRKEWLQKRPEIEQRLAKINQRLEERKLLKK